MGAPRSQKLRQGHGFMNLIIEVALYLTKSTIVQQCRNAPYIFLVDLNVNRNMTEIY